MPPQAGSNESKNMRKAVERGLGLGAALALLAMMLLTFFDVIGRKFLDRSIVGSVETIELLMLVVIFFGLPLTSLRGEHVIFDLLDRVLPRFLQRIQHRLSNGICTVLMLGGAWLVWVRAGRTVEQGDITAQLAIPMGPFYYLAAAMLVATAGMHLWLAIQPPVPVADDDVPSAGAV